MSNPQRGIVFYLHVHQPWRVGQYKIFDVANRHDYFSSGSTPAQDNERIFRKVARKSYRRMNSLIERLLSKYPDFKISLSLTGTFLEQAEQFDPAVIESFKRLVDSGRVEIVAETYHHSLAFFYDRQEFESQVDLHRRKINELFHYQPTTFRNTELAYNNDLAKWVENAGYRGVLAEGWDSVLGWRSPNYVYRPAGTDSVGLLLKNYQLSDDIAFRFSDQRWCDWPLTSEKYYQWAGQALSDAPLLNLFMDYETFGEHQWEDTGIFDFFDQFVGRWLSSPDNTFYTVSEALNAHEPQGEISVVNTTTWADSERDLTAWLGNNLQNEAMKHLYSLKNDVLASGDESIISDWRKLQTADHAYYMSTKWSSDGDVHSYFSPYTSPYDAFLYYMNTIRDMRWRLNQRQKSGECYG